MNILLLVITAFLAVLCVVFVVAYVKAKTLDEIREDVYQLFLEAEHNYQESAQGKQKMKWVVGKARQLLPDWLKIIITEDMFLRIIQIWFDGIKDLLDDGKINSSGKGI